MDPLTAGLNLVKTLIENHQMLFQCLSAEDKAKEAKAFFDGLDRIRQFGDKVIEHFHKDK